MNSLRSPGRPSVTAKLRLFFWNYPEWWSLALSGAAWAAMLTEGWRNPTHGGHRHDAFAGEILGWILMVAAMMLPFARFPIRMTALDSLWRRRHRAMAGFVSGFFVPWLVLGVAVAGLREESWARTNAAAALAFGAAAFWQRTTLHWNALMACHRIEPLSALGWRADRDCLRFGVLNGAACVASCWPLMIACAFTGHSPVAMAGGMMVGIAERSYYRPRTRAMLAVTLALAFYYVALASWGPAIAMAAPQQPVALETVGSTTARFSLSGRGETRVTLAMRPPADPALGRAGPQRRVYLNVEKMISDQPSGPFQVYLNLPPHDTPAQHPELDAGELPMFGLVESSRSDANHKALGLYEKLEITDIFARLPLRAGWDPKRLTVTFVPRYVSNFKIQVGGVNVTITRR